MRIDVHAHYWPAAYLDALVAEGRTDLVHAGRQSSDFGPRLAAMDRNGVQLQLLSAIGLSTEVDNPAGATRATRVINDVHADVVAAHPGRFGAFANVPLPFVDEAIEEVHRACDELGAVGVSLPCITGGRGIDHPDFEPFWAELNRRKAVVYVHPVGTDSMAHPGLSDWGLHTALGSPTQITAAPIRLLYSGVPVRHPDIRFIFAMCAGNLPYLWPRIERNLRRGFEDTALGAVGNHFFDWVKRLPLDPADPMAGFRRFWYDIAIQDVPAALLVAKESYGADRLLLGSDEIFASLDEAVSYIEESTYLSPQEKVAVLDHNAEQALGADRIADLLRHAGVPGHV